jgi:hypothetical protein
MATWIRLSGLCAVPLIAFACIGEEGERAAGDDRCQFLCNPYAPDAAPPPCPPGDVCSDDTPFGLIFEGPRFGDLLFDLKKPKTTAVGGTQMIHVRPNDTSWPGTFDAEADGPAFSVSSTVPPDVELLGEEPGSQYLRIFESDTRLLYDRIVLDVDTLSRVVLRPDKVYTTGDTSVFDEPMDIAVMSGRTASLVVALLAPDGTRLMDDSLDFQGSPGVTPIPETWDSFTTTPSEVGTASVQVTAAQQSWDMPLRVVDSVETVEWTTSLFVIEFNETVFVGQEDTYCFRATNADSLVLGATWSFLASENIEVVDASVPDNCIVVNGVMPGPALITVTAEGQTNFFSLSVATPATQSSKSPVKPRPFAVPGYGERAKEFAEELVMQ